MSNSDLGKALQHGFLDRELHASSRLAPLLINNHNSSTMSRTISAELRDADSFVFSVAFVTPAAVTALKQDLLDFRGSGLIITSNYLGFNTPRVYCELLNIPGLDVRVVPASAGFHAKGYVFRRPGRTTAIVGSSNLTISALSSNHEWNLRFSAANEGHVVAQLEDAIELQKLIAEKIDEQWVERFERNYVPIPRGEQSRPLAGEPPVPVVTDLGVPLLPGPSQQGNLFGTTSSPVVAQRDLARSRPVITPNRMQQSALAALSALRAEGAGRALVVSATGTGKTMLSALDVKNYAPERFVFLAHREQILDKAMSEFELALGAPVNQFGKLSGSSRDLGPQTKYLFATTSSFVNAIRQGLIDSRAFDYALIDEVHRAGARTYLEIIDFLRPDFLLGMTATPERTDGFNVFELFHYNLAYEIRLQKALEEKMLAPFHYFGVTDYTTETGETVHELSDLRHLVSAKRADYLVEKLSQYGQAGEPPRGLIFCSRNAEAKELSALLNQRRLHGFPLRTLALSGADSIKYREAAVRRLEAGELDYLLSVDVFNEGIDIPSLNQVVMMRQTQSSVVFTQQLGRGLRRHEHKDYVVVIDFIGNYTNNYLIPTALFGDTSLNKDQIRRRIIDASNDHIIAGVSSINFDQISKDRVFASLASAKLDSVASLKQEFSRMKNRLGRVPMLLDFARHDAIDPEVIATKFDHYADFVKRVEDTAFQPFDRSAHGMLTMLSREFLNGKRPQELFLLHELVCTGRPVTETEFRAKLADRTLDSSQAVLASVKRILTLEWFTDAERTKYGSEPLVTFDGACYHLSPRWQAAWTAFESFRAYALDVIETGLYLSENRFGFVDSLQVGERYTRKDVCRLLNWQRNEQATMYGYKVDRESHTCPIFVTYHKADDVSESTRYGDEFIDQLTMLWYTRSKRTLASGEVKAIVNEEVPLHLFVKKDDIEGTDFIYLGSPRPSNAVQTTMPDKNGKELPVVTMHLELKQPVDSATFDYLVG